MLAALLLPSGACAAPPARLPTLVSTNQCADLLALRLAAPAQILALSRQSRALEHTELAEQALAYPSQGGSIEELLVLKPDLVLAYAGWEGRRHARLLARQGIEILAIPYPGGWDEALASARAIGARIGRGDRAEQVTAAADARLQALATGLPPLRTLYLRPNGGSAGLGTFVDDLLGHLGLHNLAREHGVQGWGATSLEHLVMMPPELFLLGFFDQDQPLQGSGVARHPLLRHRLAESTSIGLPANGWGCGGLELLKAAAVIAAALSPDPAHGSRPTAADLLSKPAQCKKGALKDILTGDSP